MVSKMEYIKNKRILALIGLISLFVGCVTPYVKFEAPAILMMRAQSYEVVLSDGWEGRVIIGLTLINALFIFKDYAEKYIPQIFNSKIGEK
jgi:hypothetical protein